MQTWHWKEGFVFLGAAFLVASISIMLGLLSHPEAMGAMLPPERWFVLAAIALVRAARLRGA